MDRYHPRESRKRICSNSSSHKQSISTPRGTLLTTRFLRLSLHSLSSLFLCNTHFTNYKSMLSKTEERSWRGECLADGTNSISAVSATVRRRCAGRGRIWSNQAGDTSETKILITSGLEICLRIGRVPGTRDRVSNETKQTRHLPPPPFGLLSQSGRGCTPPRSKRDPRRVRTAA